MSGQIQFVDECHINGVKFPKGSIVNEADVPADWLVGAMRHGFVFRPSVPAVNSDLVETVPETVIPY
jgi:hypothetical protein